MTLLSKRNKEWIIFCNINTRTVQTFVRIGDFTELPYVAYLVRTTRVVFFHDKAFARFTSVNLFGFYAFPRRHHTDNILTRTPQRDRVNTSITDARVQGESEKETSTALDDTQQ